MYDIPTKGIKKNKDIFPSFIAKHFNCCTVCCEFPDELKHADLHASSKRLKRVIIQITGQ